MFTNKPLFLFSYTQYLKIEEYKPEVCDYEDDLWVRFIVAVMRDRLELVVSRLQSSK